MNKMIIIGEILWAIANLAIKVSILHLYIELFWTQTVRIICYIVMSLAGCLCLAIILLALFICYPIAYNWDRTIHGSCGDTKKNFLGQAIVNLCIDIAIVIIPIPVLLNLQMSMLKKLSIYFMFSVGIG